MKLNQTPNPLDRDARNKENENWDKIEDSIKGIKNKVDDFVGTVSDEVIEELIDNAKLNWREFVDSYDDLPSDAKSGDTVLTRDDGKVYRYNGNEWVEIQQIDMDAIDVIEQKLDDKFSKKYDEVTTQLAQKVNQIEFDEYKDMTDLALAGLDAKIDGRELPDEVIIENLWDPNDTVSGLLNDQTGNLEEHSTFRSSNFINVVGGVNYTMSSNYTGTLALPYNVRLVQYDKDKNYITGDRNFGSGADFQWTVRLQKNTKYVRISVDKIERAEELVFNIGDKPMTDEDEGTIWDGGFWEGIPTPPLRDGSVTTNKIRNKAVTKDKLSDEVLNMLEQFNKPISPEPARLQGHREKMGFTYPIMMSHDGKEIYYELGSLLRKNDNPLSTDYENIHDFGEGNNIQAMRYLDNKELLVSVSKAGVPGELWLSNGYGTEEVEWNKVLTGHADTVRWMDRSLSTHGEFVVVGDYGARGLATKVYLSTDYGKNFEEIFDIRDYAPADPDDAHIHGVAFDPYYSRIWIVNGDLGNGTVHYSDDFGDTWLRAGGLADEVQLTTIFALENVVLFGTDGVPNGLLMYKRKDKFETPIIEHAYQMNEHHAISHVSQLFYKKPGHGNPLYMSYTVDGGSSAGEQPGIVLATVDGINIYEVFRDHQTYAGSQRGVARCFGPTESGHVVFTVHDGETPFDRFVADKQVWQ